MMQTQCSFVMILPKAENMGMRWAAFMRKITKTEEEPFADVAAFIRNALRPYWENFGSRG